MNIQELDLFLDKNSESPTLVIIHPRIWNGYWNIRYTRIPFKRLFRFLGRLLNNKYIYWIGRPMEWVEGLKNYA